MDSSTEDSTVVRSPRSHRWRRQLALGLGALLVTLIAVFFAYNQFHPWPAITRLGHVDRVEVSDFGRVVTVAYEPERDYRPFDPCTTDAVAFAQVRDDTLYVWVVEAEPFSTLAACTGSVHPADDTRPWFFHRMIQVRLLEPFLGTKIVTDQVAP